MWWWQSPLHSGQRAVYLDAALIEMVARSFAVVEVGGLRGIGAERGRAFERLFYAACDRRGIQLAERAGARTVAAQRSASGFAHEVDAATRTITCASHWELKHLSEDVPKNELLVFNGKGLDFLYGSEALVARTPIYRFLLSGNAVRHECRRYAALWGICVIEPELLPFALISEAVGRGHVPALSAVETCAVERLARWACRDLQSVLTELTSWTSETPMRNFGQSARTLAHELLDLQEQLGGVAFDCLDDAFPDWIDHLAEDTWQMIGGW